jgi:hypothetical protein
MLERIFLSSRLALKNIVISLGLNALVTGHIYVIAQLTITMMEDVREHVKHNIKYLEPKTREMTNKTFGPLWTSRFQGDKVASKLDKFLETIKNHALSGFSGPGPTIPLQFVN